MGFVLNPFQSFPAAGGVDVGTNTHVFCGDGANTRLEIGAATEILGSASSWTVEGWVYAFSLSDNDSPFLGDMATGTLPTVRFDTADTKFHAYAHDDSSFYVNNVIANTTTIAVNTWYHVAITYDSGGGGTFNFYINGTEESSGGTVSSTSQTADRGAIGGGYSASAGAWDGLIDEVRIWTVERSASEIDDNKAVQIDPATSGLLHYYQFNDGDGGGLDDETGTTDLQQDGGTDARFVITRLPFDAPAAPVIYPGDHAGLHGWYRADAEVWDDSSRTNRQATAADVGGWDNQAVEQGAWQEDFVFQTGSSSPAGTSNTGKPALVVDEVNGHPAIEFGETELLWHSSYALGNTTAATIWGVVMRDNAGDEGIASFQNGLSGGGDFGITSEIAIRVNNGNETWGNDDVSTTGFDIISFFRTASDAIENVTARKNGFTLTRTGGATETLTNAGTAELVFGQSPRANPDNGQTTQAEWIVLDAEPGNGDVAGIDAYLADRYGQFNPLSIPWSFAWWAGADGGREALDSGGNAAEEDVDEVYTVKDLSGGGNDMARMAVSSSTYNQADGLDCDGSTGYRQAVSLPNAGSDDDLFEMWVVCKVVSDSDQIVGWRENIGGINDDISLALKTESSTKIRFQTGNATYVELTVTNAYDGNYHIARLRYDVSGGSPGTMDAYWDDVSSTGQSVTNNNWSLTNYITWFRNYGDGSPAANGTKIKAVFLSKDRHLTTQEATDLKTWLEDNIV